MTAAADGAAVPERAVPERDPGLQPERTSLAWRRTLLALLVADFFIWRSWLTHLAQQQDRLAGSALGLGIAAMAAAVATVLIAGCVLARARALRDGTGAPSAALLRTASGSVLLLASAVAASIILSA